MPLSGYMYAFLLAVTYYYLFDRTYKAGFVAFMISLTLLWMVWWGF